MTVNRPRVKICCIGSRSEAELAVRYGASALGLVSSMPSGPGVIPDELIAEIAEIVPPGVSAFLLTSRQDVRSIAEQQRKLKTNTIQLCDRLLEGSHTELKQALPGISIVQVIHVTGEEAVEEAVSISQYVDALLLDSGNQKLPVKKLGGTGQVHNWEISREIRASIKIPLYLAGGLNPENILEAINIIKPFGVDICSGVRTNGKLDEEKLSRFFDRVNSIPNV